MSQIGVFVVDITTGKPASGVAITLRRLRAGHDWPIVAQGVTDEAGSIDGLVAEDEVLELGEYRLVYDTKAYFERRRLATLYPEIQIGFTISDGQRYVMPLLLSPHAYSTYRGN